MPYQAYWISPSGQIIDVPGRHIEIICQRPRSFGLSEAYLKNIFDRNCEPLGFEGFARQEIMRDLINNGWIRLRFLRRPYVWCAQIDKLSNYGKKRFIDWDNVIKISDKDPQMEICILLNCHPHRLQWKLIELICTQDDPKNA